MAQFVLLLGQRFERHFEIARHEGLHAVAIKMDELAQELDGKEILALALFLENDLGENRTGDFVT